MLTPSKPHAMTKSHFAHDRSEIPAFHQDGIPAIIAWLDTPLLDNPAEELPVLLAHLASLRTVLISPQQRAAALSRLYTRCMSVVNVLHGSLIHVALPLSSKTRQLIRNQQNLLRILVEDLISTLNEVDVQKIRGLRQFHGITLWRSLTALRQHLLISNLAASPPDVGIWKQLHQTYETALNLSVANSTPKGASNSLQSQYFSAILLGCAQPASFTSSEINFVAEYLDHYADRVDLTSDTPPTFWIDPNGDTPAVACARKTAPPDTPVHYFSCKRLAALLKEQTTALDKGCLPQQINLPDFAGTSSGQGVLSRLFAYWGEPSKRRFPRRRQNYRAALCAGLDVLWKLFQHGDTAAVAMSHWMITNESPEGYAVMHVSGKTGPLSIGDITAIQTESCEGWQICIVRWALSENQEHLELGLHILATRAIPAFIAQPAENRNLSALILPKTPVQHSEEMLVVPSGSLKNHRDGFVLIVNQGNLEVREMRSTRLDEQNSQIDVFSIEADRHSPDSETTLD